MRSSGSSLTAACRDEHIDPRTVRKYLAGEIQQGEDGKYRAKNSDRLVRRMLSATEFGMEPINVKGSRQASQLGKYLSAVGKYLGSPDSKSRIRNGKALAKFKGKTIGSQKLITDLATITMLALAGALQLEDIYAATGAA